MPLSGHFMDIKGQVLVHLMETCKFSPTYNAHGNKGRFLITRTSRVPGTDCHTTFTQYQVGLKTSPLQISHNES